MRNSDTMSGHTGCLLSPVVIHISATQTQRKYSLASPVTCLISQPNREETTWSKIRSVQGTESCVEEPLGILSGIFLLTVVFLVVLS